ncbi:MAG: SAM-dependent methyltransferase [Bradyrhizobiaceae bacterium]|nr:SAM-dependent methyltransferase [Bradyrhizobiaceae bacterium]
MNPLEQEIRALIESEGPIPVSRYMALCLGHPRHGYYMTRDPFGASGDFVTAPEVSQMFGEMIGIWCAEVWRAAGEPAKINLVELGPGRGTLMADVLRAAKIVPAFRAAIDVHLVETSPALAEAQRKTLSASGATVRWHESVATLPGGPLIVIANEFVDALPVDQFMKTETGWHERRVGLREGQLAFALDPAPFPKIETLLPQGAQARTGALFERRDLTPVREIARRIAADGDAALLIDYGHENSGFGDTLQAVRGHKPVDPLQGPSEADLTAHVDFEALARTALREGVHTIGPVTQGQFLRNLGIELRAENLKRGKDAATVAAVDTALARLTGPSPGMGELFKAIALVHPAIGDIPGFDT